MDETNKGFMRHLGGLELKQINDTQYEFVVEVKEMHLNTGKIAHGGFCLLYTSPSPRDRSLSRMPSSA